MPCQNGCVKYRRIVCIQVQGFYDVILWDEGRVYATLWEFLKEIFSKKNVESVRYLINVMNDEHQAHVFEFWTFGHFHKKIIGSYFIFYDREDVDLCGSFCSMSFVLVIIVTTWDKANKFDSYHSYHHGIFCCPPPQFQTKGHLHERILLNVAISSQCLILKSFLVSLLLCVQTCHNCLQVLTLSSMMSFNCTLSKPVAESFHHNEYTPSVNWLLAVLVRTPCALCNTACR